MIRFITLAFVILLGVTLTTSCSKVPAGNVGVKIYLLGKDKGVDHEVLGVGRYFIGINEELYIFPTFQQTKVYTADEQEDSETDESFTFQTQEGLSCNIDVGVTFSVDAEKISKLFQKYRKGIDEIKSIVVKNAIRDALNTVASTMNVESVYGSGKAELFSKVEEIVRTNLKSNGILIEKVYLIGSIRLPSNVVNALNSKIEATQRAQQRENELREAEAEAKKQIAEAEGRAKSMIAIAEAESKSNALKLKTLTSELIQYEAIQRWDGKLPTMTGSNAIPFINIK
jgi:regulator of protease activity HflC (stomatin/prohibitin superfamily)